MSQHWTKLLKNVNVFKGALDLGSFSTLKFPAEWSVTPFGDTVLISTEYAVSNTVFVTSQSDLPTPVGGIITLEDGVTYEVRGTVTLSNPIKVGSGTKVVGRHYDDGFVIASAGALVQLPEDVTGNVEFRNCKLVNTNDSGTLFTSGTVATNNLFLDRLQCYGDIGSLSGIVVVVSQCSFVNVNAGLRLRYATAFDLIVGSIRQRTGASGYCVNCDTSATATEIRILGSELYVVDTGVRLSDSNLTSTGKGDIRSCVFDVTSGAAALENPSDNQWVYANNRGMRNTLIYGKAEISGNAVTTTLSSSWSKINAATTGTVRKFLHSANRLTADFGECRTFNVTAYVSAEGANAELEFGISLNGSDPTFGAALTSKLASPGSCVVSLLGVDMSKAGVENPGTPDYVELWGRCVAGATVTVDEQLIVQSIASGS